MDAERDGDYTESNAKVSGVIEVPLVVGGGIADPEKAYLNCRAGADVIVIGNAIEKDASLIKEMSAAIHSSSRVGFENL